MLRPGTPTKDPGIDTLWIEVSRIAGSRKLLFDLVDPPRYDVVASCKLSDGIAERCARRGNLLVRIYPIYNLYRQYLELRLKQIIREGGALLDEDPGFPRHHRINDL